MSNLPTPPAPAPEPNRIDNVSPSGDGRSSYWGLDAQETVATYVKRVRAIKAQSIALILANLVAMIWFVEEGHFALYLVCFVLLFAIVLIARVRMGALFLKLGEVVSQDCDPARYRAVLDVLSARDRFGRSANTIAIELAYCDYLEPDSAGALRRLESVTFKRKDNVRWFRAMQIEFLSRIDVGDLEGARDALARLSAFRKNFKEGSRNRASADLQVADYAVLVARPPSGTPPTPRACASAWPWPIAISSVRTGSSISPSTSYCTGLPTRLCAWRAILHLSRSRPAWCASAPRFCQGWR